MVNDLWFQAQRKRADSLIELLVEITLIAPSCDKEWDVGGDVILTAAIEFVDNSDLSFGQKLDGKNIHTRVNERKAAKKDKKEKKQDKKKEKKKKDQIIKPGSSMAYYNLKQMKPFVLHGSNNQKAGKKDKKNEIQAENDVSRSVFALGIPLPGNNNNNANNDDIFDKGDNDAVKKLVAKISDANADDLPVSVIDDIYGDAIVHSK